MGFTTIIVCFDRSLVHKKNNGGNGSKALRFVIFSSTRLNVFTFSALPANCSVKANNEQRGPKFIF